MTSARLFTAALALLLAACGTATTPDEPSPVSDAAPLEGTITVLAAASLTDVFAELATVLGERHPGVTVRLSFGASSSLREQVLAGAPADVLAAANPGDVAVVVEAGEAAAPVAFASNELQVAVPAGNPAAVSGLDDFADEGLVLGVCAAEVPCGRLAREAFSRAGIPARPDTEEPDARALLGKIRSGELDAGIVYRTDVLAAGGEVEGIDLPPEASVRTSYPAVVLDRSDERDVAEAFVALLVSEEGRRVLAGAGFGPP